MDKHEVWYLHVGGVPRVNEDWQLEYWGFNKETADAAIDRLLANGRSIKVLTIRSADQ